MQPSAVVIWCFAPNTVALNAARDLGGRLAAITIWGTRAFGGRYAAIGVLTNIAGFIIAYWLYQLVFYDARRRMLCLLSHQLTCTNYVLNSHHESAQRTN
jgi:hypothetical protein